MPAPSRLILAASTVAAVGIAAAVAGLTNKTPVDPADLPGLPGFASYQPIAGCIESIPGAVDEPQFRPDSLRLPDGSITIRTPEDPAPGLHIIVYAIPTTLDEFVEHVLAEWPDNGWELGRGEREAGEAEGVFYSSDRSRYGQFRARAVYCDRSTTEVTLTLGENVRAPGP